MALLENYPIVRQLLEAVGLSVFHTLWAGCLLLLLLIVVLKVIPTQRAKARFTVSLLTLQLLFLLFGVVFFYQWNQVTPTPDPVVKTITAPLPTTTMVLPSAPATVEVNTPPAEASWLTLLHQWSPWLATLWLLGGVFHAIQLLLGVQHTRRLRTHAQPLSGDWEKRFAGLKQCLGIKQQVIFWESAQTAVPLTFGWLKPVVLIPTSLLTQLSPEQVEMIVLHELAHIRRYDYLWSLLQSVAEVILFYHPAYWYIARVLEREREFACDQMTVVVTQQPETYARTLLKVASTSLRPTGWRFRESEGYRPASSGLWLRHPVKATDRYCLLWFSLGFWGIASATFAMQWHHLGSGDSPKVQEQLADLTEVDYGPSFEEAMAQVSDQTLDTTSLTLNEIYERALTIDQYFNQLDRSLKIICGFLTRGCTKISLYRPLIILTLRYCISFDGLVRDPKSVRCSEVEEISVYRDLDKLTLEGIDL